MLFFLQRSAVQISNVQYKNIKGTSETAVAVTLDCSKSHPCQGIVMQDINLAKTNGGDAQALCKNVRVTKMGKVSPSCS